MAHKHDDHASKSDAPKVKPRHYKETRMQPRVRQQWDPAELARKYLDEMEEGGRLHKNKER